MKRKFYSIISFALALMFLCLPAFQSKKYNVNSDSVPIEFKLFNLINNDQNFMISPISIKILLMMIANDEVSEDVKNEILSALEIKDFELCKKSMFNFLTSMKEKNIVDINNSIWFNEDNYNLKGSQFPFQLSNNTDKYDYLHFNFFAEKYLVNSCNAVNQINNWVYRKTNGKIKEIINNGNFSSVWLNTTYFKQRWKKPFNKHHTHKGLFHNIDDSTTYTDFMSNEDYYNFYENDDFKMVEISYDINTSMYVFLPNNIKDFNYEWVKEGINNKFERYLTLQLPKFISETDLTLNNLLKSLGMRKMFYPGAINFNYQISDVLHKTFIDVNEEGTEAAAATAAIARCCLSPRFNVNKPFIYIIRENESGEILFMGSQSKF